MSCKTTPDVYELTPFPAHLSKSFPFTLPDGVSFSAAPKCVITDNIKGSVLDELTVGNGISITGQVATITVNGQDFKRQAGGCLYIYLYLVDSDNTPILKIHLEKSYK